MGDRIFSISFHPASQVQAPNGWVAQFFLMTTALGRKEIDSLVNDDGYAFNWEHPCSWNKFKMLRKLYHFLPRKTQGKSGESKISINFV